MHLQNIPALFSYTHNLILTKLTVFSYKKNSFIVTSNTPVQYTHNQQLVLLAAQYMFHGWSYGTYKMKQLPSTIVFEKCITQ